MGPILSYLIILLVLLDAACAHVPIYFTGTPTAITVGTKFTVTWIGGDYVSPISLTLMRGTPGALESVQVLTSNAQGLSFDWTPDNSVENGEDYELMLTQGNAIDYSPPFAITGGSKAATSSAAATTSLGSEPSAAANSSSSQAAAAPTVTVTETPTPTPITAPSSSSSSESLLVPVPTSSFDAPVQADTHLTVNDKIAIGIGVPIALLVLSTVGYWRAVKYFVHRKVTGEPRLPMHGSTNAIGGVSGGFSSRSSYSSRPHSLWGAASRRGSVYPEPGAGYGDTELLTAPKIVHTPADARPSSTHSSIRAPSMLRQEWHAV